MHLVQGHLRQDWVSPNPAIRYKCRPIPDIYPDGQYILYAHLITPLITQLL